MNSQQFDAVSRAAGQITRRGLLRWAGAVVASLAAGTLALAPLRKRAIAAQPARRALSVNDGVLPPPAEPWGPDNPPDLDEVIDDYVDCIAKGHTPEECDRGFPGFDWCEIVWANITQAIPNIAGFLSTFTPFSRNCGGRTCFQCCYRPAKGCHSSFIGFPVINCNEGTYGAGTKPVGLTLILDPDVQPEDSCLFIQQVCAHIALCVSPGPAPSLAAAGAGRHAQGSVAENYLTDPRAVDQRATYFAQTIQSEVHKYLDTYATTAGARPLQTLLEALGNRGRKGWRSGWLTTPLDVTHPALRINDAGGNMIETASYANAFQLQALARVLTGVPNLAERLASIESRTWPEADKAAYLAGVPDPDQALTAGIDAHWLTILKRVGMLQDYALFAVPLPGETIAPGMYGGEALGRPPVVLLRADGNGAGVALTVSIADPEDVAGRTARPVAVAWGDGQVTRHSLPSGQSSLVVVHSYAGTGRYAVYTVVENDSGLRGYAALVVDASAVTVQASQAVMPAIARIAFSAPVAMNLAYTKSFELCIHLVDDAGASFPAGRSTRVSGPTDIRVTRPLGDTFAHNTARLGVSTLRLEPRTDMKTPASSSAVLKLTLTSVSLGVLDTATQQLVETVIQLTPDMLRLYVAGSTTPLAPGLVTVDAAGALQVPVFRRASSSAPWERIDRIDIALAPAMFAGLALNATPIDAPAGTQRNWVETRPGVLEPVTWRTLLPLVVS